MNTILNIFSFLFRWEYYKHEFFVLDATDGRLLNKVIRPCRKINFAGKELKQYLPAMPKTDWMLFNDDTNFYE